MDIGTKTSPATAPHLNDLDGIRGILVTAFVLDHYGLRTVMKQLLRGLVAEPPFLLMEDFFFVSSGFVLVRSYSKRPRPVGNGCRIGFSAYCPCMPSSCSC